MAAVSIIIVDPNPPETVGRALQALFIEKRLSAGPTPTNRPNPSSPRHRL